MVLKWQQFCSFFVLFLKWQSATQLSIFWHVGCGSKFSWPGWLKVNVANQSVHTFQLLPANGQLPLIIFCLCLLVGNRCRTDASDGPGRLPWSWWLFFDSFFLIPTLLFWPFPTLNGKSLTCAIVHLPMVNFSDGIHAWPASFLLVS